MELKGKRVAVVGFGRTGRALVEFLKRQGAIPMISEKQPEKFKEIKALGVDYEIGNSPEFLSKADMVVVSPGVPWNSDFLQEVRRRGVAVMGDVDFALPFLRAKLVGITGSNGKSTTVSLTAHILKKAGLRAEAGGNIGKPLISFAYQEYDYLVVELSSFQLEASSPEVFVSSILNCSPDHLARHGSFEEYCAAKERLLEIQKEGFSVLNKGDSRWKVWREKVRVPVRSFSSRGEAELRVTREGGWMGKRMVFDAKKMKLLGLHNMENAAASFLIALGLSVEEEKIREGLYSFYPLEHRMEVFAEEGDKIFINDSKATNVDSVRRALEALDGKFVVIMGGRGKGENYRALGPLLSEKASLVIVIGEEADRIREDISSYVRVEKAGSLEEAVALAFENLPSSKGILLSPACASYDMFSNFEERGRVFKREVSRRLKGGS